MLPFIIVALVCTCRETRIRFPGRDHRDRPNRQARDGPAGSRRDQHRLASDDAAL